MTGFSSLSFSRGERYFAEGRVLFVETDGQHVYGLVRGNASAPYQVVLDPNTPHNSLCSCPVRTSCKHAVALYLSWLEEEHWEEHPPEPLPTLRRRLDHANEPAAEISLDLDQLLAELPAKRVESGTSQRDPGLPPRPSGDLSSGDVSGRPTRSWRAAFLAGPGGTGLCLSAVKQYRRKDGSYGRLEMLRPFHEVAHVDAASRALCERLFLLDNVAPLTLFVETLLETTAPIFFGNYADPTGAQNHPIEIIQPEHIGITVLPVLVDDFYDLPPRAAIFGECGLTLELEVHHKTGSVKLGGGTEMVGEVAAGRTLLFTEKRLLLTDADCSPLGTLAKHAPTRGLLSIEAVAELEATAKAMPESLSFARPAKLRTVPVPLEPIYTVEIGSSWATLKLRYELSSSGEDGYQGDEYLIHTPGEPIHENAYDDACKIVGEDAYRRTLDGGVLWSLQSEDTELDPIQAVSALLERGYTVYVEERGTRRRARSRTLSVTVTSGIDWFDLETRDSEGEELGNGEAAWLTTLGWYERNGEAILLDAEGIERLRRALEITGGATKAIPATDIASIAEAAAVADSYDQSVRAIRSLVESLTDRRSSRHISIPAGLTGTLRSYQVDGYRHLARLASHRLSGCLADDMGLGKTIQALAFMLHLHERGSSTFLVVAPVSTLGNWEREAGRFAPSLNVRMHHGSGRADSSQALAGANLVLTSYATAQRDYALLSECEWALVCLDEAQFIKNPRAKRRRLIKQIPSQLRLCLTGTPVENITTDLWSIIDFLVPGLLGSMPEFHRRFPKRRTSEQSDGRLERLRRIVAPFMLRRTKEAVAPELPPKIEMTRTCAMGTKQSAFYRHLKQHHRTMVANAIGSGDIKQIGAAVFTGLLRLRQAALYPEDADREGSGVPSIKEEELLAQLEENCAEGHKALVFSQFVTALRRLRDRAREQGIETYYLDGQTKQRGDVISGFQEASGSAVFFVSLKAGGTGINLTAADYVYICDPWWNPQVERQAIDRAHRIGRENPVVVTRLIAADTVEEKVLELQDQKRELASSLIAEDPSGLRLDDPAELLSLFE